MHQENRAADPRGFADAVILAAGSSQRMGSADKLFFDLGGLPLVGWTVSAFARAASVQRLIIVTRADRVAWLEGQDWVRQLGATVVAGGDRRQESVAAGVEAATSDVVLIHDGARPLVSPEVIDRVAHAALEQDMSVPVVPVPESMLAIDGGEVTGELDKTDLYKSQTPHGIRRDLLLSVYGQKDPRGPEDFIDEPSVVRAVTGTTIAPVPGSAVNLKVTTPGDEELTLALLESRALEAEQAEEAAAEADESPPARR